MKQQEQEKAISLVEEKQLISEYSFKSKKWRKTKKNLEFNGVITNYDEVEEYDEYSLETNQNSDTDFYDKEEIEFLIKAPKNYPKKGVFFFEAKSLKGNKETAKGFVDEINSGIKQQALVSFLQVIEYLYELLNYQEETPLVTNQKQKEVFDILDYANKEPNQKLIQEDIVDKKNAKKKVLIEENGEQWIKKAKNQSETEQPKKRINKDCIDFQMQVRKFDKIELNHFNPKEFTITVYEDNADAYFEEVEKVGWKLNDEIVERRKKGNPYKKFKFHERLDKVEKIIEEKVNYFNIKKSEDYDFVFRRKYYACCSVAGKLFIYGGKTADNKTSDDFIRINFKNEKIDVFKGLSNYNNISHWRRSGSLAIPRLYNHNMLALNSSQLLVIGNTQRELKLYLITSIHSSKPKFGGRYERRDIRDYNLYRHPVHLRGHIPSVKDYSFAKMNDKTIILFGGKDMKKGKKNNRLYELTFRNSTFEKYHVQQFNALETNGLLTETDRKITQSTYPSPRSGCSSSAIFQNFYLYGGTDENEVFRNELFVLNTSNGVWTEIDVSMNLLPPPLFYTSYFQSGNKNLVITGGINDATIGKQKLDIKTNPFLYSFDVTDQKFYLMDTNCVDTKGLERFGFQCCSTSNNSIFLFGGMDKDKNLLDSRSCYFLTGCGGNGKELELPKYLNSKRIEKEMVDACFIIFDQQKNEFSYHYCHRCIISARCPKLDEKITKFGKDQWTKDDGFSVDDNSSFNDSNAPKMKYFEIKDFSAVEIECFLTFLYTGEIKIEGEQRIKQFLSLSKKYLPKSTLEVVQRICSKSFIYLDTCQLVLKQLKDDLQKISKHTSITPNLATEDEDEDEDDNTQVVPEAVNHHNDLELVFRDGSTLFVHKLFLIRSKYFHAMLTSQFKESKENRIDFSKYNKQAIIVILTYLYSGRFEMNNENCIPVLIYSLMFRIVEVCNFCRKIVKEYLNPDVVIQLLNLAIHYNDLSLKAICINYVIENFENISKRKDYQNDVDGKVKFQISERFSKLKAKEEKKKQQAKKKF